MIHNKIILLTNEILKKYSSEQTRLSQADILRLLESEYGFKCDRKALGRALELLSESDKNVKFTEKHRGSGYREYTVKTEWYVERTFSAEETDVLILSLLKSGEASSDMIFKLISKISGLGKTDIDTAVINSQEKKTQSRAEIENLKTVISGIKDRRMLTFSVIENENAEKHRLVRNEIGKVEEYLVKPIDVVVADGRLYLFGEIGDSERYSYFSINNLYLPQITDIGYEMPSFDTKSYVPRCKAEEQFLVGGNREKIVVAVNQGGLSDFFTRFGGKCEIVLEYGEKAEVVFECNITSALRFLLQFGEDVEVISPSKLRRSLAMACKNTAGKYLVSKQFRGYM